MRIFRSFPYFISLCPRLLQTLLLEAPHSSTPTPAARSAAVAKRYGVTIFNGNIVLQWPKARNERRYTRTPSSTDTSSNYSASMAC